MIVMNRKDARLVLGGVPRVDLLPPEVAQSAKSAALHRGLTVMVVAVMVLVGAGYGLATAKATGSQHELDAANQRTTSLLLQQKKFVEVGKVTSELKLTTAARQVGSSTEIDWRAYLQSIQASLPAGTAVVTFTASSASPLAVFVQPTVPLQGERIAELAFSATSESLPDVQAWLNALAKLSGFVDAAPQSVTLSDNNTYLASIKMHINEKALANRFAADAVPPKNSSEAATGAVTDAAKDSGK